MAQNGQDPSDVVSFFGDGLLHKFGFSDGDLLYGVIEEHDLGVDHHDLLVAVVEQQVVPRLDQTVVTSTWPRPTLHNPIRAVTVDGEEASIDSTITPEMVEVPVTEIIRIARSLPSGEEDTDDASPAQVVASDLVPYSFGADQLTAATRQVRRTFGGAELHLHHWLAAVLNDESLAGRVLAEVDRDALATALHRRLDEGDLEFPFPEAEARDRAGERARRAGHDVVTTDDLAGAVATAGAGLMRQLGTTSDDADDTDSNPTGTGPSRTRSSTSTRGRTSSRPSMTERLIIAVILAVAIGLAIGWMAYRQRSTEAEDTLRDRVEDFAAALASGDGDAACKILSNEAAEGLAERVRREIGKAGPRSCPAAVQLAANGRTPAEDRALIDLAIGGVDYDEEWTTGIGDHPDTFERATATVVVAGGNVTLLSESIRTDRAGSWTVEDPGPILDLLVPD